jgi:hypothetical protein
VPVLALFAAATPAAGNDTIALTEGVQGTDVIGSQFSSSPRAN